ncbi:tRNA (N(6)-L-threonylcarbamoyladenosine(37)-C(2))-methylthiotransferase MtaB [Bacteroidales bacterium OttesenSCG-928-K03]|nr:tRNA (N(6)-L-threonylcarbamoyladenosine(37)-C(2))-methylthiotransferase MtaB [Bacteroidales bacterium OttesenSCG-928-K03]
MINISFQTFGCKLNFSETSTIAEGFNDSEYQIVKDISKSDFHIIHSCTVTEQAEKKCRQAIRHAAKINPNIKIIVLGCYSQLHPDELNHMPNVVMICGNESKFNIHDLIKQINNEEGKLQMEMNDDVKDFQYHTSISNDTRTRTFLKIQDGCNYFCTYCAVPYARGRSRSDKIDNVLKIVKQAVANSTREIVLSGVNLGDFGNNGENLFDLLIELTQINGLDRIRISSIEPNLLENRIIQLAAEENNIMPHFHIPLQSGSDKVLSMMKRRYDTSFFKDKILEIKQFIPDACIAVDLITGFPGENNQDFEDICNFIQSIDISYLHIFSYSDRPEALASKFSDKVSPEEIIRRSKILHQISDNLHTKFINKYSGIERNILFEMKNREGNWVGWTDNYIRSEYKSDENLKNEIKKTKVIPYYSKQ